MGNAIVSVAILFSMALGLQAPWQVNDICHKPGSLNTCMKHLRNKLHTYLMDVGNGSMGLRVGK
ncbi:MAG: hypothetical protein DID91_2727703045 [Candidatus Nitrotoga sp. MKT]|nr:MAG: hypothetical protein DID91_2727703045 [Candidatus Nitrotoga sp. MKT]